MTETLKRISTRDAPYIYSYFSLSIFLISLSISLYLSLSRTAGSRRARDEILGCRSSSKGGGGVASSRWDPWSDLCLKSPWPSGAVAKISLGDPRLDRRRLPLPASSPLVLNWSDRACDEIGVVELRSRKILYRRDPSDLLSASKRGHRRTLMSGDPRDLCQRRLQTTGDPRHFFCFNF